MPEFGIRLPVAGPLADPDHVASAARWADDLGYASVWVHDFIVWTRHLDSVHISVGSAEALEAGQLRPDYAPRFFDSLVSLAYVAALTKRVRVGVAVLCLPFRNPVVTAKQIATLDVLSKGRLILGVGVGAASGTGNRDFEVLGVSRDDKYRRTREYVKAMQTIWTEPTPSFSGRYVSFEPTELDPKPAQKPYPPIWVGGAGAKAIEMIAEFGTGWLPGRLAVDKYPELIAQIHEGARSKGRGSVDFTIGSEIYACIGDSDDAAWEAARRTIEVISGAGGFAQLEAQQAFASHALIGSADTIRRKVERFAQAGVQHFEMKFIYRDMDHLKRQLDLFASGVLAKSA